MHNLFEPAPVTEQNFLFFNILQAVAHFRVDRRLQLGKVIQDLLGRLEHVRDGGDWGNFGGKLNIAVRLGGPLSDNFCRISKPGLLHPENCRRAGTTWSNQITDKQSLFGRGIDTRQTLRFNNTISNAC